MILKKLLRTEKKWLRRSVNFAKLALVMADLNPVISEPIRFGSLLVAQAFLGSVFIAGLVFGCVTLLLDALGTLAVVDLLDRDQSAAMFKKAGAAIKKIGLSHLISTKTGFGIDFCITLLVGTPITIMLKQWQDPERSAEDNVSLGMLLSVLASLAAAFQGTAIVAGLWHPNALTVVLALIAIASIIVLQNWLKKRFS